jgi:hypothetical protein
MMVSFEYPEGTDTGSAEEHNLPGIFRIDEHMYPV